MLNGMALVGFARLRRFTGRRLVQKSSYVLTTAFRFGASLVILVFGAVSSSAFQLVWVTDEPSELIEDLQAASLLHSLPDEAQASPQEVLGAARADYGRLIAALYDNGFFSPVISIRLDGREASDIPVVGTPDRIDVIRLRVEAGPRFVFGQAQISPLAPETALPEAFRPGQTATTTAIRNAATASTEGWRNIGHAKAGPGAQSITADHANQRLDVAVQMDPGPRLRFGALRLEGNSNVRPERLREIAGLPTGQIFSPAELDRARTRLQRTGTFRVVSLTEAEEVTAPDLLPINANIVDRLPRSFGFGAEASSLQGLTVSGYWQHRNLWGGAERLRFDAEISGIGGEDGGEDLSLSFRFDKPATRGPDTDYYGLAELEALDEVSFSSDRVAIEAGFVNRKTPKRTYTYGLGFEYAETEDAFGQRDYFIMTLPLTAELDYRDSDVNATTGTYGNLTLTPFYAISGTKNGLRTTLDVRHYRPLGDRTVLALRGQLGSIFGPALSEAPADYLFYSGGGGTVRGQSYQSLGVTLPSGRDVGGRSFLGLSAELRVKAWQAVSVVGFADAGYIGEETFPDGASGDWHSGAGLGIRYDTGVGPIRFDVALPVSGPGDNTGVEFYIGIGQAF